MKCPDCRFPMAAVDTMDYDEGAPEADVRELPTNIVRAAAVVAPAPE